MVDVAAQVAEADARHPIPPDVATKVPGAVAAVTNAPYDQRTELFKAFVARGMTPQQAMGSIYGLMGESSTALDPNANVDNGNSYGMAQVNGKRKAALDSIAAGMGTTWNDPRAQVAHILSEIDGPEKAAFDRIKANATTAADATNLWTAGYERPKVNNWQTRYIQGSRAGRLDADGNPTWTTGPAAPLPTGAPTQGPNLPGTTAAPADTRTPAQKFADAAKKGDVGGALGALASGTDSKGNQTGGALGSMADAMKGAPPPSSSSSPMLQTAGDNQGAQAEAGQQLLGQVMQQSAKPLSWSSAPYGAGTAGQSVPGTTINSIPGYPGMIVTPAGYV
jgi:hypothetical protein